MPGLRRVAATSLLLAALSAFAIVVQARSTVVVVISVAWPSLGVAGGGGMTALTGLEYTVVVVPLLA